MKLPNISINLRELFNLSKDPTISVSRTPFGADLDKEGEQLYLKKAVPWKGVKGVENIKKVNKKVGMTIEKLAKASEMLSGIKGTVIVNKNGKLTMMPKKAYIMMKLSGKPVEVISSRPSYAQFRTDINTFERNVIKFVEKMGEREKIEQAYRIGTLE